MPQPRKSRTQATREAVQQASKVAEAREAARQIGGRGAEPTAAEKRRAERDPLTGELRKREVLPLLVLHFMKDGRSYGNQLMERISSVTEGVLIEGSWEHPERRSRRYYSLTSEGRQEYERLVSDTRPFLDSVLRSIEEI